MGEIEEDKGQWFSHRSKGMMAGYSEAVYENRLKPFTLSAGTRYAQKFIDNDYSGDATLTSQIHSSRQFKGIDRDTNSLKEMETGVAKSGK